MQFYYYNEKQASDIHNTVSKGCPTQTYLLRSDGVDPVVCTGQLKDENNIYGQYTLKCLETWNSESSLNLQVSNICHGICGELAELLSIQDTVEDYHTEVLSETGDVFYYRQLLRYNFADSLSPTISSYNGYDFNDVLTVIALFNDVGKKVAFHNKFSAEKTQTKYALAMVILDNVLKTFMIANRLTPEQVMQYNINKLQIRHPNGFNSSYTK